MPITGIDHVMVAVPDLAEAEDALARSIGLVATRGVAHPGFGTANRIIHVPGLFLELITVADRERAGEWHAGRRILEVCDDGGGLLAFVLAVRDLDATVAGLCAAGLAVDEPVAVSSVRRGDGTERTFRIAGHGEEFRAGRLPSLIEPTDARTVDPLPDLGFSWRGLVRADVAVHDLGESAARYARLFGVIPEQDTDEVLGSTTATFGLPDGRSVRLVAPRVPVREGLFGVALGVDDLDEAVEAVSRGRGVPVSSTGVLGEVLLDPRFTAHARISLVAAPEGRATHRAARGAHHDLPTTPGTDGHAADRPSDLR